MEHVISREIPAKDLFMMCRELNRYALGELPEGYHFRTLRRGELDEWKGMLLDFPHSPETRDEYMKVMSDYYDAVYAKKADTFFDSCLVACEGRDKLIGRGFIWKAYGEISTVHWYKVLKDHENRGVGRAILSEMLRGLGEGDYPVYLHTHPSSYRAIKLYSDFGFQLLTNPIIGKRNNDLAECLPILKKHMARGEFERLSFAEAPRSFADIVGRHEIEEL